MLTQPSNLRCCAAYLHSTTNQFDHDKKSSKSVLVRASTGDLRALVVEFRDEVYASLKGQLDEYGFAVERAASSPAVAAAVSATRPDLILINGEMPYESGWLTACKLRLARFHQPIWLYMVQQPKLKADWKKFSGVNEVIEYQGVLLCLLQNIRYLIAKRVIAEPSSSPAHEESDTPPSLLVA